MRNYNDYKHQELNGREKNEKKKIKKEDDRKKNGRKDKKIEEVIWWNLVVTAVKLLDAIAELDGAE